MGAIEKYNNVFVNTFEVDKGSLKYLKYQDVPLWDSVGHMTLVSELEDAFDIMMDTEDIVDLNSYSAGITILEKYGIQF